VITALNRYYTWTASRFAGIAKIAPYPPCTGTVIWLACRRVPGLLPDAASGNVYYHNRRAVRFHPKVTTRLLHTMIKSTIISAILTIGLTLDSFSQGPISYEAKCKEFGHIRKYTCIHLILNSDSTFKYEEIAGDLPLVIENGYYFWNGDTLVLKTKNLEQIRYIKRKNTLSIQYRTDSIPAKKKIKLKKKGRKPNTDNMGKLFVTVFAFAFTPKTAL